MHISESVLVSDTKRADRNESEETEEIKTSPNYPYLLQG